MRSRDRQDETDVQLKHAPPLAPRRESETNRLQEAVIEAAQRLRRGFAVPSYETPLQPQRPAAMSFHLAHGLSTRDLDQYDASADRYAQNDQEDMSLRIWAGLMPKFMAPPPPDGMGLPNLRTTAGVVGAVVAAAGIALAIVNVMQLPISIWGANDDDTRTIPFFSSSAPGSPSSIPVAETKTQAADAPSAPANTSLAAPPTDDGAAFTMFAQMARLAAVLPSAPESSQEVEAARPELARLKAAVAPEAQPASSLTRDEIAALLGRGRDLIAAGDIASARLILTHLAEAGDADAAFMLAGTLDPAVLATRRIVGVQGDPARARAWYERAAEQGSLEARRRLDQSAPR